MSKMSIEIRVPQQHRDQRCWILKRDNCSKVLAENDLSLCKFHFLTSSFILFGSWDSIYSENSEPFRSLVLPVQWAVKEALALPSDLPMGQVKELGGLMTNPHENLFTAMTEWKKNHQTNLHLDLRCVCFSFMQWESKYQLSLYSDAVTSSQCRQPVGQDIKHENKL